MNFKRRGGGDEGGGGNQMSMRFIISTNLNSMTRFHPNRLKTL